MKYWMVFFDTNSATLNDKAASTVAEAAGIAKAMANSTVTVTGFTDTDGSPAYNMAAVAAARPGRQGCPGGERRVVGGDHDQWQRRGGLLVATPDQTKMESNRRVQIVVQ